MSNRDFYEQVNEYINSMDKEQNELALFLFEDNELYDITYNGISLYELLPTLTAITVGGKTYKVDEYYNPEDEIILHLERSGQRVTLTTDVDYY